MYISHYLGVSMKNILKNSMFLVALSGSAACFAMENELSTLKIKTTKYDIPVSIGENTTVLGVKKSLLQNEGISIEQQSLNAVTRSIWPFWFIAANRSPVLNNDQNVKTIMDQYNTDTFELYLTVRPNQ